MADPFASATDVADRWRPLSAAETTTADNLVGTASTMLRNRFPDIDDRIAAGTLDADLATQAVVEMIKRVLRNLEGVRQRSRTTGPFTQSESFAEGDAGELEITDVEIALLRPPSVHRGAGTIRVGGTLW